MAKTMTHDAEKGYQVSLDTVVPTPGSSEGIYVNPGDDEEDSENVQPVRGLVFKSAEDSNVKVWTKFNEDTGLLEVTIGVYYV